MVLTSCFLTGLNSSFVAASSIEGLIIGLFILMNILNGVKETYHSSEDSESVKVGVGLRFRFRELLSSTDATASLSARLFKLLVCDDDATAVGGGDVETFSCPLFRRELSYERSFSSCSRNMLSRKSPRRTRC